MSVDTTQTEPQPGAPPRRRGSVARVVLTVVLVVVAIALLAVVLLGRFVAGFNPFDRETVDRTQPAVLLALRDLSEYHAATGEFQVVVDTEDSVRNLPLQIAGERTLFVAGGSVDASIDFAQIADGAVTVDDERTSVRIVLPPATLSEARVDPDTSYVFSRERGLVDRIAGLFEDAPTGERELFMLAEDRLADAAGDSGLTQLAERNTEAMLRSLMLSLGFTDVTVTFE